MTYRDAHDRLTELAAEFKQASTEKIAAPRDGVTMDEFCTRVREVAGNDYFALTLTVNCHRGSPPKPVWGVFVGHKSHSAPTLRGLLVLVLNALAEPATVVEAEAELPPDVPADLPAMVAGF